MKTNNTWDKLNDAVKDAQANQHKARVALFKAENDLRLWDITLNQRAQDLQAYEADKRANAFA